MSLRDELLLQWEKYLDRLEEAKKTEPPLQTRYLGRNSVAAYSAKDDVLTIGVYDEDRNSKERIRFAAGEAEELYRFLGALYGE
jgi:hypothetical protein